MALSAFGGIGCGDRAQKTRSFPNGEGLKLNSFPCSRLGMDSFILNWEWVTTQERGNQGARALGECSE